MNIEDPLVTLLIALVLNFAAGALALRLKYVDRSGFYAGVVVGMTVTVFFGWQAFAILFSFFLVGSLATRFRNATKTKLGVAQKNRGVRSARHVIANGGVPFLLACAIAIAADYNQVYQAYFAAMTAALATALGDTLSTELGQVYGKKCYLLITMERVKVGTEGAVSYEGTMWGIAGAASLAVLAAVLGMFPQYPVKTTVLVILAALIANLVESIVAGIFGQFGRSANEFLLNFANTAIGAGLCFFFVL